MFPNWKPNVVESFLGNLIIEYFLRVTRADVISTDNSSSCITRTSWYTSYHLLPGHLV